MTIKIKVLASWTSSEEITKRLLDQFYIDQDLSDVEFVHDGDCDFVFNCNYEVGVNGTYQQRYAFTMEPTWSGNYPKHFSDPKTIVYAQTSAGSDRPHNVIEHPTFMFYGSGGEGWTYKEVMDNQSYPKTKNISSIVSMLRNGMTYPCLYDARRAAITTILASNVEVDVYGWDWSWFPRAKGLGRKFEGLLPYRFSLAIENTHENNYITEKFYDPILTNTIPIYFGAKNIREIFPENGYVLIEDINDTSALLKQLAYVNANAESLYQTMLPELKKIQHRFFTEFNLLNKILKLSYVNL